MSLQTNQHRTPVRDTVLKSLIPSRCRKVFHTHRRVKGFSELQMCRHTDTQTQWLHTLSSRPQVKSKHRHTKLTSPDLKELFFLVSTKRFTNLEHTWKNHHPHQQQRSANQIFGCLSTNSTRSPSCIPQRSPTASP